MKDSSSLKTLMNDLPSDIPSWMRATCKESFRSFVKFFWEQIPGAGKCVWNWHMDVICAELQELAERVFRGEPRKYDEIFNVPFGSSKPVWEEMPVLMADGYYKPLREVEVGDYVIGGKGNQCKVTGVHVQGNLECVKIVTFGGREVITAYDHPILTTEGWVEAQDIVPENAVALMHKPSIQATSSRRDEEFVLAGYLIGDGCVRGGNCSITNTTPEYIKQLTTCLDKLGFGYSIKRRKTTSKTSKFITCIALKNKVNVGRLRHSSIRTHDGPREWVREIGLEGLSSYTKIVPNFVWAGTNDQVRKFLAAYFHCDGCVSWTGAKKRAMVVSACTVSYQLAVGLQRLFLRLGVSMRLRTRVAKKGFSYNRDLENYKYYTVETTDQDAASRFLESIPLIGYKLEKLKMFNPCRRTFEQPYWPDRVQTVENAGPLPCRCLTVEGDQSFTANDVVVHNSSLVSILFNAWVWTRMPQARFLTGSHTDKLTIDLSTKTKAVIQSDLYRACFPEVKLSEAQSSKEYFTNTHGGDRNTCTVGGKTPMGFHAHFLICVSRESKVITDEGVLPIGDIVEERKKVRVLGYDHTLNSLRWQKITSWQKNQPKPLCRVKFSGGRKLELTGDHPVYVIGKGYVHAEDLLVGDEVICAKEVQKLRKEDRTRREGSREENLLHVRLLEKIQEQGKPIHLRLLQRTVPQITGARSQSTTKSSVLLDEMSGSWNERGGPSSIFEHYEKVLRLRESNESLAEEREKSEILQQQMQSYFERKKAFPLERKSRSQVPSMWRRGNDTPKGQRKKKVLQASLCPSVFFWGEGNKLHTWNGSPPIPAGVQSSSEEENTSKRGVQVLPLREEPTREWKIVGYTPHKLGQELQRVVESGKPLSGMPFESERCQGDAGGTFKAIVLSCEKEVRVPEAVYNISTEECHNFFANGVLVHNCDDPIDPQGAISEAELDNADRFISEVLPSRKVDKAVSVTILVMQRIHYRDPTAVMQREAKKEGASPIRQIVLPGEIDDGSPVLPAELKEKYTDGLLDANRLPRKVLNEYRARGELFYATQVQQRPYPPTGGMFKAAWFSNRVKAAPYHAVRVRGWDRAASQSINAARTAGVLMAMTRDPLNFYVEDIVVGHWEPDERNARMLATARRDRARYGPGAEPIIIVEMEGGSSGRDAWKGVARALAGFPVFEERVTGSKDVRAEPWAAQLAAMNVALVEDGTWDIEGAVLEHLQFIPESGRLTRGRKDIIDSCSLCFNYLINRGGTRTGFRVLPRIRAMTRKGMRIAVMTPEELLTYNDEAPALITFVNDPPVEKEVMPVEHVMPEMRDSSVPLLQVESPRSTTEVRGPYKAEVVGSTPTGANSYPLIERPIDCYTVCVADLDPADYQEKWLEPVEPWKKLPEELVMTKEQGKKLWAFLTKKRMEQSMLWVFVGRGRAPISMAMAAADAFGLERSVIYWSEKEVNKDTKPANKFIYEQTKFTRNSVVT